MPTPTTDTPPPRSLLDVSEEVLRTHLLPKLRDNIVDPGALESSCKALRRIMRQSTEIWGYAAAKTLQAIVEYLPSKRAELSALLAPALRARRQLQAGTRALVRTGTISVAPRGDRLLTPEAGAAPAHVHMQTRQSFAVPSCLGDDCPQNSPRTAAGCTCKTTAPRKHMCCAPPTISR